MEDKELMHYGVLGMKWGVRKAKAQKEKENSMSDDAKEFERIKKKKVHEMSNNELQTLNKRIELENKYNDYANKQKKGKKIVQTYIRTATTLSAVVGATATYRRLGGQAVNAMRNQRVRRAARAAASTVTP